MSDVSRETRKPSTPWDEDKHGPTLEAWSGHISAERIGKMTGHCAKVILELQRIRGLPTFHPKRAKMDRRSMLLAGAAGLAVEGSPW